MKKHILFALILLLNLSFIFSQNINKVFFDKKGTACSEEQAYYYRENNKAPNFYKSIYVSSETIYFEGQILNATAEREDSNIYVGTCIWYYKNGNKKVERKFNEKGVENGISTYYYETGKINKEIEFKNGKILNNKFKEYGEDGQVSSIMEDEFNNNSNDWDVYDSDKSSAKIKEGVFELMSLTKEGTSRYISLPIESSEFAIEATINCDNSKGNKAGIIWGFKDWQNYNYFLISNQSYYLGTVYEGISSVKADAMYAAELNLKGDNLLKILCMGEKTVISINGAIQNKINTYRNYGSNIGFTISGKSSFTIKNLIVKEIGYKNNQTVSNSDMSVKATGTGLMITQSGYIITNYHVVENNNKLLIEYNENGVIKSYEAKVIQKDIDNDLAIIKINDESFKALPIKYSICESGQINVGASVFTIGFPYALGGMGKEAKFTDGKISAKTGFDGAINSFQTSIPVQPGNSGGPVFNEKGQLIGLINAKFTGGDNVSYAIKLNYLKNLIELLPETINLQTSSIESLSLEDKIKEISAHVVLIKIK